MRDASIVFSHSEVDSRRFGLRIFRGSGTHLDERTFFDNLVKDLVDVAIIRMPAGNSTPWHRLARRGLSAIHADTLVYYEINLATSSPAPLRNDTLEFSVAGDADTAALKVLVGHSFANYVSHYHANPAFAPELVLEGYVEWAAGFVDGRTSDRTTWVARKNGEIVAFACCSQNEERSVAEGVLFGVHPDHAGGGLYGDLIRHTQAQFKARGFKSMVVSTQIWNFAVQKVWAREGFVLTRAYDTYHVNAFLEGGELLHEDTLTFTPETVRQFAEATGDWNPLHFEEAAAKAQGFEGPITHGMLVGGELSRIFGMGSPGPGTLFLRATLTFLAPVYPSMPYRLRVRRVTGGSFGHMTVVATLSDSSGNLRFLGYNDLLHRS